LLIDRLKIDRFFLSTCLSDPSAAAILTAVISLAPSFGISTIAAGVETEDQRLFLLQQGSDEVQGSLMGRPSQIWPSLRSWPGRPAAATGPCPS
jgi:EAL domain-containing protein (putative c-di-GMP-specific phosphodiesterase class I)